MGKVIQVRVFARPINPQMVFESLVTNPGRLRILTALAAHGMQEFVHLRQVTNLSDGNLATHAKRLQQAGLITIHKQIREGKPVTRFGLNQQGRAALETHARQLLLALGKDAPTTTQTTRVTFADTPPDEEWVD
jgi:DNA-binding transcriptional ArsR family regulator